MGILKSNWKWRGKIAGQHLVLAAIGFVAGGVGLFMGHAWWRSVVVGSAALSTAFFILFWDGKMKDFNAQGGIGILINLAILVAVLIPQWSPLDL